MGNPSSSESWEDMAKAMEQEDVPETNITTEEVVEPKVDTVGVEVINPE